MNPLIEEYQKSLLGRLKVALFREINTCANDLPTGKAVRAFILKQYRENAPSGPLFHGILTSSFQNSISYESISFPSNPEDFYKSSSLGSFPLFSFFEVSGSPTNDPPKLGVLIERTENRWGHLSLNFWLIDEAVFPGRVGYGELYRNVLGELVFAQFDSGGWNKRPAGDAKNTLLGQIAMRLLAIIDDTRNFKSVDIATAAVSENFVDTVSPPGDDRLDRLIKYVKLGLAKVAHAEIELSSIRSRDMQFERNISIEIVQEIARDLSAGSCHRMLVYWEPRLKQFIMNDDYPLFVAHKRLKNENVPCAIVGPFPKKQVTATKVGGLELLPPVVIKQVPIKQKFSEEIEDLLAERRFNEKPATENVAHLSAIFIAFSHLLSNPGISERDLHDFLEENPITLHSMGVFSRSEVRLGEDYRVDMVFEESGVNNKVLLIELENSTKKIFTKSGRLRAEATHALQQVEDWLRWWMENPSKIPEPFSPSVIPSGLVVMGRSSSLSDAERSRLTHLNSNRSVQFITYDEILDQILTLIEHLDR